MEEHARSGIGDGEPEEPKVKGEDESVEDIDVLQGSSSDSMGEDGSRDLTCEGYDDEGIPKSEPDLHEVEPEEAGALNQTYEGDPPAPPQGARGSRPKLARNYRMPRTKRRAEQGGVRSVRRQYPGRNGARARDHPQQ